MPKERQTASKDMRDLPSAILNGFFFDVVSANAQKGEGPDYIPNKFPYNESTVRHGIIHHADGRIEFGPDVLHRTIMLDKVKVIFIQSDSGAQRVRVDLVEDGFMPISFKYSKNGHDNETFADEYDRDRTRIIKSETLGDGFRPHFLFSRPLSREEAGRLITALEDPEKERDTLFKLMEKTPQDRWEARRSLLRV